MTLQLEDISYSFGGQALALDRVSLRVAPGELCGVLGPNGAGKSTLAHIALGLLSPSRGRVSVDDIALASLPAPDRARRIASVLQREAQSFGFTGRQVVLMGRHVHRAAFGPPSDADRAAVEQALDAVDARAFADRPTSALSGGERQRILVARALAQHTPYIVLDEPTTFFDIGHTLQLGRLLRELAASKGIVWVLHDPSLALRFCTHACLLLHGRQAAFGPAHETLEPTRLGEVFGVHAEVVLSAQGARHLVLS